MESEKSRKLQELREKILKEYSPKEYALQKNLMDKIDRLIEVSDKDITEDIKSLTEEIKSLKIASQTKSPACRISNETKNECVSRKIPELMAEGMSKEQAIAVAESVCSVPCEDKVEIPPIPKEMDVTVVNLAELEKMLAERLSVAQEVTVKNPVKQVEVKDIKNVIEILSKIADKETKIEVKAADNKITVNIPTSNDPEKYIPVRLTDGKKFYKGIAAAVAEGSGLSLTARENLEKLRFSGDNLKTTAVISGDVVVDNVGLENIAGTKIDPATEQKQNDQIANQTNGLQKTQVVEAFGDNLDIATETTLQSVRDGQSVVSSNTTQMLANQTNGTQKTQIVDTLGNNVDGAISAKQDPLAKYHWADLDNDATPNYYGAVDTAGNWFILKEDKTAKTYRYAAGSNNYATNWTNRLSLTYDYLFNITIN